MLQNRLHRSRKQRRAVKKTEQAVPLCRMLLMMSKTK
jgi:hypothetical protein